MQIIILAAGKGSRLGNLDHPKALTALKNGQTLLGRQIALLQQLLPNQPIHIVVGYRKELIMQAYPKLNFVISENYAAENTAKSLMKALKPLHDAILWLNGDVVFHPNALQTLIDTGPTSMLVNTGQVGQEEVKYRLNPHNEIIAISKEVTDPLGEAVGINYFKKEDAKILLEKLIACQPTDYFEKGIEVCIQEGMRVKPATIPFDQCVEVDFPSDLQRADELLSHW